MKRIVPLRQQDRETCVLPSVLRQQERIALRASFAVVLCILLLESVHAQQIYDYHAVATIRGVYPLLDNPGRVEELVSLSFTNTYSMPITELSYPFGGEITDLKIYDSEGKELSFSKGMRGGKTYISATFKPLPPGQNYTLTYDFTSQGNIRKSADTFIMTLTHPILANVKNFELAINLPEGYVLAKEGVTPELKNMFSDGRRVILIWDMREPIPTELRGDFKVIVLYERVGWYPSIYYIIVVLIILGGAGALAGYIRKTKSLPNVFKNKEEGMYEKINILKEDEQQILRIIIEHDGIDQREIQKITGFSKTKVSKILTELEKRETIRKEAHGRRNKIFLTNKIKET